MPAPTAGLVTITDPAAAFTQNPYYNSSYTTGYGVYGSTPTASYYQQVASGLRAQNASFTYGIGTATPSAYYGGSYPTGFDYTAYNPQYYNGMRTASYYPLSSGTSTYSVNKECCRTTTDGCTLSTDVSSDLSAFSIKGDKKGEKNNKKTCNIIIQNTIVLISGQKDDITDAVRQVESLFASRTEVARRCLEAVAQRTAMSSEKYANIVMCSDGLVPAVAQLLLSGLAHTIPIENIYSTNKAGKEAVLDRIQHRFGKKCSYVVVTSHPETNAVARKAGYYYTLF
uniref:Eyes absent homolog n=1 Tax=Heterorhabditis bacteriophora TaxID=37862 RepID=A0A1I7WZP7_HETBA